jgi:hypothetical protein
MNCHHCEEPILPGERSQELYGRYGVVHIECFARMVQGSVGHQMRRCPCFGGTEEDPPGTSKREAARASYEYGAMLFKLKETARYN